MIVVAFFNSIHWTHLRIETFKKKNLPRDQENDILNYYINQNVNA